jgi:hypothetical protein
MRSILVVAAITAPFLLPNAGFAQPDTYDDCRTSCAADRDSRNSDCPSPYDSENMGQDRAQCLQASRDAYASCIQRCPSSLPPPPESTTAPITAPMGGGGY